MFKQYAQFGETSTFRLRHNRLLPQHSVWQIVGV